MRVWSSNVQNETCVAPLLLSAFDCNPTLNIEMQSAAAAAKKKKKKKKKTAVNSIKTHPNKNKKIELHKKSHESAFFFKNKPQKKRSKSQKTAPMKKDAFPLPHRRHQELIVDHVETTIEGG